MKRTSLLLFTLTLIMILVGCNLSTSESTASTTFTTTSTITTSTTSISISTSTSSLTTADITPPIISGTDNLTIFVGQAFSPLEGVFANDDQDGDVTSSILVTGLVNINQVGSYPLTYTARDKSNNATQIERIIHVVLKPLDAAILAFNESTSMTMDILFESGDDSYMMNVWMGESAMKVDVLDETVYYEIDNDVCYFYELVAATWTKSAIECSDKGTLELQFLTNFAANYFVEQTIDNQTVYVLKMEYYNSLQLFLGSTITSNYQMTLDNGKILQIRFTMIRNSIEFDITITLSHWNETQVTLPEVNNP